MDLTDQLDLDELCTFVAGADLWTTPGSERLGIGSLIMTDGPNGARGSRWTGLRSACFPCGSALGATWDVELVAEVGAALGRETRAKGAQLLLGPTVNLHRHPLGGRHFECMSEDPCLTARLAVAYIEGLQSERVGCTVKHFVANDSEYQRMSISSDVDERTLRELYLVPFEAAVTEGGTWAVMSAYNRLNGTYCSEDAWLLRDLLRGEWGFDGIVVSDWHGTYDTVASANGGVDVEMPGPPKCWGTKLAEAVRSGKVDEAIVREKARHIVTVLERVGALDRSTRLELEDELPGHDELARRAAAAAIVLVRNDSDLLPLDPAALSSVAVIGPNAGIAQIQGGGSAQVTPHRAVTPLEGLRAAFEPAGVQVVHERGCRTFKRVPPIGRRAVGEAGLTVTYRSVDGDVLAEENQPDGHFLWIGPWSPDVPPVFQARITASLTPDESGPWTLALTSAGRSRLLLGGEVVVDAWEQQERSDAFFGMAGPEVTATVELVAGRSYDLVVDYLSDTSPAFGGLTIGCEPPEPADLMERAVAAAEAADVAVVVVGTNDDWETEGVDRTSIALPGRQVELVTRTVAANPRTIVVVNSGAPVDLSWAGDVPAVLLGWFAGQAWGAALADVVTGAAEPGGRMPTTWPRRLEDTPAFTSYPGDEGHVRYGEGLFVGYRWYDARTLSPAIPFGHGVAYTTFERELVAAEVGGDGRSVDVRVRVTNTGDRAGSDVIQCYVHDETASVQRPEQELRAFAKVTLEPGQTEDVVLHLGERAFAFWSVRRGGWVVEPGWFELRLGASSVDIWATARVELP
jgi:beta-glucosidase